MPTIVYLDTLPAQNGLDILHSQSKVEIEAEAIVTKLQ